MNKNLLHKLSSILVAGSMVATLSGCGQFLNEDHRNRLKELKAIISTDSKTTFRYVYAVRLLADDAGYYIQFECHDDNGANSVKYLDHKHYLVTYKIEKSEYQDWLNVFSHHFVLTQDLNSTILIELNKIALVRDPISIEEKTDDFMDGV